MKFSILVIYLVYSTTIVFSQKPILGFEEIKKWPFLGRHALLSNDGRYAAFQIDNEPFASATLIVKSTFGKGELKFPGVYLSGQTVFTSDSKRLLFPSRGDSLVILRLENKESSYLANVRSFKVSSKNKTCFLAYQTTRSSKSSLLVLHELSSGTEAEYGEVSDYRFCFNDQYLLFVRERDTINGTQQSVCLLDVSSGKVKTVWQGINFRNLVLNENQQQLAFFVTDQKDSPAIWYYDQSMNKAKEVLRDGSELLGKEVQLSAVIEFSAKGSSLYIELRDREAVKEPMKTEGIPNVWNYKDDLLQSAQNALIPGKSVRKYKAILFLNEHRLMQLEHADTIAILSPGDWWLIYFKNGDGDPLEIGWNVKANSELCSLISGENGLSRNITGAPTEAKRGVLSPSGNYLLYYDTLKRTFFSYHLESGVTKNLTQRIENDWSIRLEAPGKYNLSFYPIEWSKVEDYVVLRDFYDFWKIDLNGLIEPECITNKYGRQHRIIFENLDANQSFFSLGENKLLGAFGEKSKKQGFFIKKIGLNGNPNLRTMSDYYYNTSILFEPGRPIVKAKDANCWLFLRENSTTSPNYYFSTDLIHFKQLSDIHPERQVNWLTTQMASWQTLGGTRGEGILYKPQNFDSTKKYPVIIQYYEQLSNELNYFPKPHMSNGPINIPWFVSRGYLVLTPDIHYSIGYPAMSAFRCVSDATDFLTTLPFVDITRIAIAGHSFGGYETNVIITKTNRFAAALSAAGLADLPSMASEIYNKGTYASMQPMLESRQLRIGYSLAERPDLYIQNSPLFSAAKVSSPLLMMHNADDQAVPFKHGLEFYNVLRRAGKKVWLLQYPVGSGGHVIDQEAASKDYTQRITQFFDHYLKGALAPKWMTVGVPARMKGIDTGLELDSEIKTPGESILTPEEKKKMEATQQRKPMTVTFE